MRLLILAGAAGAHLVHDLADTIAPEDSLTVVAPTTRDAWVTGLKRSPDLDAVLAGRRDTSTFGVAAVLDELAFGAAWHRADDTETALRLVRTELLHAGFSLTEATEAMGARRGLPFRLLPLSDVRGELHAVIQDDSGRRAVHIDEHGTSDGQVVLVSDDWAVAPTVTEALGACDLVVVHGQDIVIDHALAALEPLLGETPVRRIAETATVDDVLAARGPA